MQPSPTDLSPIPKHPSSTNYSRQRHSSIPSSQAPIDKDSNAMLLNGRTLTPWKSADSLVSPSSSPHANFIPPHITGSTLAHQHQSMVDRQQLAIPTIQNASLSPNSAYHHSPHHPSHTDQQDMANRQSKPSRIRKFSFSRSPQTPTSPRPPHPEVADVKMTTTINKDYDPATGNKIINKYMIIKEIGRGVHGKVKLAEDCETGEWVAIKIVDKRNRRRQLGYSLLRGNSQQHVHDLDQPRRVADLPQYRENEQKIRREIAILKKCAHPHVVKLREVMDDPASRKIYMALEYMEGGEIEWRDEHDMPVLMLDQARSIFRDVVSGLDYLHYQGIIHRDIKPANLLLTKEGNVKISDFGVSYFNEMLAGGDAAHRSADSGSRIDRELAETAGTPAFFAPELCCAGDTPLQSASETADQQEQPHRPRITKAIDVWALGVTLYCFVFGRCPFTASTEFELFDTIPTEPLKFPDPADVGFEAPDTLKDLLSRLLTKNPDDRITLEQVKHHPWVIEDLEDPQIWWEESDPTRYKTVEVTDEEVTHAVTIMDRLRKSIQKLSTSLSHLTHGLARRRSKSVSQASQTHPPSYHSAFRHPSNQPPVPPVPPSLHHPKRQPSLEPHELENPAMVRSVFPSRPTEHTDRRLAPPHSAPLNHRPISCLSDETTYSTNADSFSESEKTREEDTIRSFYGHTIGMGDSRPSLARQASSASSSSGIGITIRRSRGGLTPLSKN